MENESKLPKEISNIFYKAFLFRCKARDDGYNLSKFESIQIIYLQENNEILKSIKNKLEEYGK